jgi:hypothetical protein
MRDKMIEVAGLDECKQTLPEWEWGVEIDGKSAELVTAIMIDGATVVIDELAKGDPLLDKIPMLLLGEDPLIALWPFNGDWPEIRIKLRPLFTFYADGIGEDRVSILAFAQFLRETADAYERSAAPAQPDDASTA